MFRPLPTLLLVSLLISACGGTAQNSPLPTPMSTVDTVPASALAEAIKFRVEFGLPFDEPFVRAVFANPAASSADFGVPLLPDESAALHRRASLAADVALVVRTYGASVPESFAGDYIDPKTGTVFGLFVGDVSAARAAIEAQISPLAQFVALPARNTLQHLDSLLAAASVDGPWFASVGAPFRGGSVRIEDNVVWLFLGGIPADGLDSLYQHFGVDASSLTVTVEPDVLANLPRGSIEGVVVDQDGAPVTGRNLDVVAIGDIGNAEPDGGIGIATNTDGTFTIAKLPAMGWQITIRDPATGTVLGETHAGVTGGETTQVRIEITP